LSNKIERKFESILSPIQAFVREETVSSGFLFAATVTALILANSPLAEGYFNLLELPIILVIGMSKVEFNAHTIINDGLMALFFLVLGLPDGVDMRHVIGLSLLGGMGFTMSIFITELSFSVDSQLYFAKIAILCSSAVAGLTGYLWLRYMAR